MLYDGRRHGFIQIVSEFLSTNGELRFGEKFLPTSEENNIFAKLLNISGYDEQDNSYTLSLTADAFEKFGQKIYTDAKTEAINESKAYIDDKLSWGVINNNE